LCTFLLFKPAEFPILGEKIMPKLKTADLYLSSFLKARGARLTHMSRVGPQVNFEFEDPDLNELVTSFYDNGPVPVMDFTTSLRALRGALQNVPREGDR